MNATGQEGTASEVSYITLADGNLMTVTATGEVKNGVGFNVYAGVTLNALYRQNDVPLAAGGTYTYVPGSLPQGPLPGKGQMPDFIRPLARTWLRG